MGTEGREMKVYVKGNKKKEKIKDNVPAMLSPSKNFKAATRGGVLTAGGSGIEWTNAYGAWVAESIGKK